DHARELDRRVAPAATDVEDTRACGQPQSRERRGAVIRKSLQHDVAEALELRDQHVVPERGELVFRIERGGHRRYSTRLNHNSDKPAANATNTAAAATNNAVISVCCF